MAATTNRRFTELYRNSTVFETKQAAITGLYNHELINSLKDGEPLLARYMAYFTWDEGSKQYVLQSTKNDSATFTRIVSNETSVTSTKEYIVGDIINVTATEGNITTTKSYKCSSIPQGGVAVPVGSNFATSGYFTEITSASVTPQSVKTIRVLMAVATVFEDNSGNPSFKKEPPKGRLTIFEEDDAIREMINKASISSPDGTINISDAVSGKEIQVNLGTSLIKNITPGANFGKIDVNFDGETIIQDSTSNALKVNHGNTLKESETSGEVGKLDVKTGDTIKISAGGTGNPDAGTLDVKTGTSLKVSAGGASNPELGTIDVNIDNQSIKQYASDYATAALQNKLYVNVDNASGLNLDSTNGIQVKLGNALAFRSGDSTAANNGKIDVQYDDDTIGLNGSNQLVTNFHSGTAGGSTTMERKSHTSGNETVYDGWGVKHGTTISENTYGIHVNIDDVSIKQIATGNDANKLYVNHDTTIVTDSTNGLGVNIDNKSIKQYAHDHVTKPDQLYVNIDGTTLVSDPTTGVISVSPTATGIYGENAIKVETHYDTTDPEHPVANGKTVKLDIDSNDPNVLSQSNSGLKVNLNLRPCTSAELANLGTNVKEAYKLVGNAGSSETQIGSTIKIYKDGSLYTVYLGTTDDTMTNMYAWSDGTNTVYTNKTTGIVINTDKVYSKDQGSDTYTERNTITGYDADAKTIEVNDDTYTYVDYATPWIVVDGTSTEESLNFVYEKADGSYELVKVNLESFLQEAEFKDGLNVDSTTHEVSVKLYDGLQFHDYGGTPAPNKSIQARIGDGINFGSGNNGEKPIIARIGNGLQFNSSATSGQKPIELRLGGGLEYNTTETDGQRSVEIKVGTGIGIDTATGHVGELYVNYGTIGASNRPVYFDGTNHTPVQIDHTIDADVPSDAVFTDTLYYSGNEITIDSTNNHINHDAKLGSNFTSTTAAITISGFGGTGTFKVPVLNINQYGHVTSASEAIMSITLPDNKIITYTAPTYSQGHLSNAWVTAYTDNAIVVNTDTFDSGINKLDNKIKALADELSNAEATFSQAIEDETRYFAKSTTATAASGTVALTATVVDNRAYNLHDGTKVDVYFQNDQNVSNATLAISGANGASAAKYLVYNDQLFNADMIEAGTTLALVYDAATITIGGVQYAGVYRVVGGVGSGSGSGSTNGITDINAGNGINVTKNYTEVTINSSATPYSSTWFKDAAGSAVITPATSTVYRVITAGNYYNMAYTWDDTNSKYVLSTDIKETVAVKLAANMIPEGSTSGSATEISGLGTLLKFTSNGELAMENTWDCGTY